MRLHTLMVWMICSPLLGCCQLYLERQAFVGAAMIGEWDGGDSDSSIGQASTGQYASAEYSVSQGFHQPTDLSPLQVELKVWINDCDKTYEVQIVSVVGCDPNASKTIEWNSVNSGLLTKNLPSFSTLRITTSDGCLFVRSYDLSALSPLVLACDLRPFNYLTPNGDGSNDYFHIENIDRPNYQGAKVAIFNRWGQLIWEGKNYDNTTVRWSGKNTSGSDVPAGTYYYTIEVLGTKLTGYVELMQQ